MGTGDFTVSCNSQTWLVHSHVLAAASPVLFSMVTGPMKEAKQRKMEVQDADPKGVQAMIEYLYLGVLPKMDGPGLAAAIKVSHMYGFSEMLHACGTRATLEDISKDDMVEVVRALRPLTNDDEAVHNMFAAICKKIQSDDELFN